MRFTASLNGVFVTEKKKSADKKKSVETLLIKQINYLMIIGKSEYEFNLLSGVVLKNMYKTYILRIMY